jgi:DHA2 family multidrug resistance protein
MDVFMFIGVMFLCCIPFVLLVKSNKKAKAKKLDLSEAMH